jgi:glucosylceramidase
MIISVNVSHRLQEIVGYGAGLPQSSAYVLRKLKDRDPGLYKDVMTRLFDPIQGIGISFLRFPIGSCDFSMHNTSYDEVGNDFDLSSFAIDPDSEDIVTVLLDAMAINPRITTMATPWSAPSWMKVMGSLIGWNSSNTLINTTEVYDAFGRYMQKTVRAFADRGIHLDFISVQNEPLFGDNVQYPGMYLSPRDASVLAQYVKLYVRDSVKILSYDHNWDRPDYPIDNLEFQERRGLKLFDGVAWHCYAGDMATGMDAVSAAFPDAPQYVTECTASFPNSKCDINRGMDSFCWDHEWDMQNLFLGASAHGSKSGVKWIMALDEDCGPVLPMVEWRWGRPFVSVPSDASKPEDMKFNQDYYTTGHMSKFIRPGASRVLSTVQNASPETKFLTESFFHPATQLMHTIFMNLDHTKAVSVSIDSLGFAESTGAIEIPAWSTVILQFSPTKKKTILRLI